MTQDRQWIDPLPWVDVARGAADVGVDELLADRAGYGDQDGVEDVELHAASASGKVITIKGRQQ